MTHVVDPKIAAWQTDHRVIGMIEFSPSDTATKLFPFYRLPVDVTFLGLIEADALCLTSDGALVVYDHEVSNRVFCSAAPCQVTFLAALDVLEKHFEKCVNDESYWNDESAAVLVREHCAAIVGGEEYDGFFCMMVGT